MKSPRRILVATDFSAGADRALDTALALAAPTKGALFRSSSFQKSETELVIIVTPHLVKPLDMTAQTLPTDYYVEPYEFEYYMTGLTQKGGHGGIAGQRSPAAEVLSNRVNTGSAMEGRVGHLMP